MGDRSVCLIVESVDEVGEEERSLQNEMQQIAVSKRSGFIFKDV